MNLLQITKQFAIEEQALDYLVAQRWPDGVTCLGCGCAKVYRIDTKGKTGRPYRKYECSDCELHFSPTTGTLFHNSHLPLQKWFMVMALMTEAKKGISALQVSRHIGVPYKTAWYLCHRIRKAMEELNAEPLGGQGQVVEIDETFLGGSKRNRRKTSKEKRDRKIKIVGMVERGGRVRLQRVATLKVESLRPVIDANLSHEASKVVTDAAVQYSFIVPK